MKILHLMTLVLLATAQVSAQEQFPDVVTRLVNDDTIAIAQINLKSLDLTILEPSLRDGFDVTRATSSLAQMLTDMLQKLKHADVTEVYLLLGASDLPIDGVMIAPTANPTAVAEVLKSVLNDYVEEIPGAVIAGSKTSRQRLRTAKTATRPELVAAIKSLNGLSIRVAIAPSADARRVLREFLPMFPMGGPPAPLIDGVKWLALGGNITSGPEFRLIGQAVNPASAQSLEQFVNASIATLVQLDSVREVIPKSAELRTLLLLKQQEDRIVLSLTEGNGGIKRLIDEAAKPLISMARTHALQRQTIANLKMLGLAMYNYHDTNKGFPPSASLSKEGRKLLSWRVHLLPFLDEGALYKEFHLDEPWDSEHNKKLIDRMPAIFESPNVSAEQRRQGQTTYLVPVGEKTVFERPIGTKITEIADGTSNTIMIVDGPGTLATIWTKPDDLLFDPKDPWKGLAVPPKAFFWATLCDGSARKMENVTPENLRRYFQMNDGEVIDQ